MDRRRMIASAVVISMIVIGLDEVSWDMTPILCLYQKQQAAPDYC
jgi:hypothetical protein